MKVNKKTKYISITTLVLGIILLTVMYINNIPTDEGMPYNETVTLKIYHPNSDATITVPKDYTISKDIYEKDKNRELVNIINSELDLGINSLVINENKAVVDISKEAIQNKFDWGSTGGIMAVEGLVKTIFANTNATVIKVTVDGEEKVEGNHFSFVNDFIK